MKIAIVGRPNVGKSALFNRIVGKRMAIVDEDEGVTRDRISTKVDFFGKSFYLVDTGGIDSHSSIPFNLEVKRQAEVAIGESDAIILVVDGIVGPTAIDKEVIDILFRSKKRVFLAVNKVDECRDEDAILSPFYSLGIKEIMAISALHGHNVTELVEKILEGKNSENEEEISTKIAIVGRPNVGKSTILNYILGQERTIVSPIAGTTRDAVDVSFSYNGRRYVFIDTAGLFRKSKERDVVDKFARMRSEEAIKRADICLLVAESFVGLNMQDKKILSFIENEGKGIVILFNKFDMIQGLSLKKSQKAVEEFDYPCLFISVKKRMNLDKLFPTVEKVEDELKRKITTSHLNKFLEKTLQKYHPPMISGKRLRIYYITQVGQNPPRFILFVNRPALLIDSYKKYLINQFRENFNMYGVPIFFEVRGKERAE